MERRYDLFTAAITSLYQSIQKIRAMEMERFHLKTGHVTCLHLLDLHPEGITHADLTKEGEMDKAAVSRYLSTLRERGYVFDEEDNGKKYNRRIFLTKEGREIAKQTSQRIDSAVQNGSADMTEEERKLFYKTLNQIAGNLQTYIKDMEEHRK